VASTPAALSTLAATSFLSAAAFVVVSQENYQRQAATLGEGGKARRGVVEKSTGAVSTVFPPAE